MRITEDILRLEEQLAEITGQLAEIKMQVYALEEKNGELLHRMVTQGYQGEDTNLKGLYSQGYHVCPEQFAQVRDTGQDCLYCMSFLKELGVRTP